MSDRRSFLKIGLFSAIAATLGGRFARAGSQFSTSRQPYINKGAPVIISTWNFGLEANEAAIEQLNIGGSVLDAVEKGVNLSEADPEVSSVGLGGLPDADGEVTLDACIMGPDGNAGSVTYLKHILHPVSVARLVMEKTPHVMLSGEGALAFALQHGFEKTNLLTPESKQAWEEWKASGARYAPKANWENHDTIGMLAIDDKGDMAGACTTSGMAFKHPGRVGDSPIIGAGMFVDNQVGAAAATGEGEAIMKTLGSFLVVEFMRNGMMPEEACKTALMRIMDTPMMHPQLQIAYIALDKSGNTGAYSLKPGFQYAVYANDLNELLDAPSLTEWD